MSALGRRALAMVLVAGGLVAWSGAARVTLAGAQDSTASSPAVPPAADVERLRERAAAYWAARVAGDTKTQWELLEPRGRGRLTPADYAQTRGVVRYLAYQVEDATVNGHFAAVQVRLLVHTLLPAAQQQRRRIDPRAAVVTDRWVRIGGTWYRSLEQESTQPGSQ